MKTAQMSINSQASRLRKDGCTTSPGLNAHRARQGGPDADAVERSLVVRWDQMPDGCNFIQWVEQLGRARKSWEQHSGATGPAAKLEAAHSAWRLVGQGVIVEHDDGAEACGLLAMAAQAAQMAYVEISAEQVVSGFDDWRTSLSAEAPTLLHLQAGDWIHGQAPAEDDPLFAHDPLHDDTMAAQFRLALAESMAISLPSHPVVLVLTVTKAEQLAQELRGAHQFVRKIGVPEASSAAHGLAFLALCRDLPWDDAAMQHPSELGAMVKSLRLDQRLELYVALRHTVWRDNRPMTARDLIECQLFGMCAAEPYTAAPLARWRTAVHEAGHVLTEYLVSGGASISAYCSVRDHGDALGIAVPMHDVPKLLSQGERGYADMLQDLKRSLGGRVAEHVLLGEQEISASGSVSDLERATRLALRIVRRGLPLVTGSDEGMSANLFVDSGPRSDCDVERQQQQAARLLQSQYLEVLDLLRCHVDRLTLLASHLNLKGALMQDEIRQCLIGTAVASTSGAVAQHHRPQASQLVVELSQNLVSV